MWVFYFVLIFKDSSDEFCLYKNYSDLKNNFKISVVILESSFERRTKRSENNCVVFMIKIGFDKSKILQWISCCFWHAKLQKT